MSSLTRLQEKYEKLWAKREARIAELEGALRPFARNACYWDSDSAGDLAITVNGGADVDMTVGDFRRARELTGEAK